MKKYKFLNTFVFKSFAISIFAFIFAIILKVVFKSSLSYVGIDTSNLSYLIEHYNTINKDSTGLPAPDDITIISISKNANRDSLAHLIDYVCGNFQPIAVGVDIYFPPSLNGEKTDSDSNLIDIVKQNRDIIVLAQVIHGNRIMPSIFDEESYIFGSVNDSNNYVLYSPSYKSIPLFSYKLSELARNKTASKMNIDNENFIINYSSIEFRTFEDSVFLYKADKETQRGLVDNKIVLIGGLNNFTDYHQTPFFIKGEVWTEGLLLHAYEIYSLIKPQYALKKLPDWGSLFLCWILSLLYSMIFVFLTDEKYPRKIRIIDKHYNYYLFFRPLLLFFTVPSILWIIYMILGNYIPNVVVFLITIFIINTFNDYVSNKIKSLK